MKVLIQRVSKASVIVEGKTVGKIGKGYLALVGITHADTKETVEYLAKKTCNLRIFRDENDKMNLNLKQVGGKILAVSQFTLYGDASEGNRPSFTEAAKPELANELYEYYCEKCRENGLDVEKGIFGADMKVKILNDGPVTIMLEK